MTPAVSNATIWSYVKQHKVFLGVLFIISSAIRLLFYHAFFRHGTNAWIPFDTREYFNVASNILQGYGISVAPFEPNFYRLPGYPLFVALCQWLSGGSLTWVAIIHILLASFIPALVFCLSLALFPRKVTVAKIAAVLACAHMGFIIYANMFATESLCILFLLLFFILLFPMLALGSAQATAPFTLTRMVAAGLCLGGASLFRAIGHYLIAITIILLLISSLPWRKKLLASVTCFIGWCCVVGIWLVRNFLLTGYLFFHTLPGAHFLHYWATPVCARVEHKTFKQAYESLLEQKQQEIAHQSLLQGHALNAYEQSCVGEQLAFVYLKQHPIPAFNHAMVQVVKTCLEPVSIHFIIVDATDDFYQKYATGSAAEKLQVLLFPHLQHRILRWCIYLELVFIILVLMGWLLLLLGSLRSLRIRYAMLRMLPFIILLIGITVAFGSARLRLPAEPLLIIGATAGWAWLCKERFD
jgi:hypothetical protein